MDRHFPEDYGYTKDHEWCNVSENVATIGITWHAQNEMGDIVYCELPEIGEQVALGQTFGVVESVKAVSDLYSPVTGVVVERNNTIIEAPEGLNDDTYDDGWMVRIKMNDMSEIEQLLTKTQYEQLLEEEAA